MVEDKFPRMQEISQISWHTAPVVLLLCSLIWLLQVPDQPFAAFLFSPKETLKLLFVTFFVLAFRLGRMMFNQTE